MGYLHIENLYKNQTILQFKKCYALEKIHGTSTHISWDTNELKFFSGGENYDRFVQIFNVPRLTELFKQSFPTTKVTVFGEGYGGKQQGMSKTYGPNLKFVAFDVKIGESWLSVPQAEKIVKDLELEFVDYVEIETTPIRIDSLANSDSVQAIKNGMGYGLLREGVVLRPLIEMRTNNGERVIAKYKNDKFKEREHQPKISDEKLEILKEADKIADEWVTPMRLTHVLDKFPTANVKDIPEIIKAMIEDITREASGEIVMESGNRLNNDVFRAIGRRTALLFKQHLKNKLMKE